MPLSRGPLNQQLLPAVSSWFIVFICRGILSILPPSGNHRPVCIHGMKTVSISDTGDLPSISTGILGLPATAAGLRGRLIATGRTDSGAFRGYRGLWQRLANMNVLDHGQALFEIGDRLTSNRRGGLHVQPLKAGKSIQRGYGCIGNVPTQSQSLDFCQARQRCQVPARGTGQSPDRQTLQFREPPQIPQRRSRQGTRVNRHILKMPQIRQERHIRFLQRQPGQTQSLQALQFGQI